MLEQILCQDTVVATFESAVEDLLDHVVNDIVEEVVPSEAEEEVLSPCVRNALRKHQIETAACEWAQDILTNIVGTT